MLSVPDGLAELCVEAARLDLSDDASPDGEMVADGCNERGVVDGACDCSGRSPSCRRSAW